MRNISHAVWAVGLTMSTFGCSGELGVDDGTEPLVDGGVDAASADVSPVAELGTELYPSDRSLSPITPAIAENLRDIAAAAPSAREDVFAKVGDSVTVSTSFMHCFAGDDVNLGEHSDLAETVAHFGAGRVGDATPFDRASVAAVVGWNAGSVLSGTPSALSRELSATDGRFATLMYGTNDIGSGQISDAALDAYAENMQSIVDTMIERGVVPLMSSIMPRDDSAAADVWVPRINAIARGVAQSRGVPFMDFHRELVPLPGHGLGGDDLHPNAYSEQSACWFTAEGLTHGYNVRNLLALQTLDRARRVVAGDAAPYDASAPVTEGDGSPEEPFTVALLPYADARNTAQSPHRNIDTYGGCAASSDESGPEYWYVLELERPMNIRAMVLDRGDADVDIHLMSDTGSGASCVQRAHRTVAASLPAGTHYFAVDTYVSGGTEHVGDYLFVVLEDE